MAWAGMRGAVSLAAALSLPLQPEPFPERDLLIYLTFCVILATLVGQGLTLPWIVGRLGLVAGTGIEREESLARQVAPSRATLQSARRSWLVKPACAASAARRIMPI